MPGEGDLLVMGGAAQRDWLHGIPAADTDRARISLTWRWTSRRGRPDTNPAYSEGRQFSDAPPTTGLEVPACRREAERKLAQPPETSLTFWRPALMNGIMSRSWPPMSSIGWSLPSCCMRL